MDEPTLERTKQLFSIHISEDGSYFAIRDEQPRFCLEATSIAGASAKAERAFASWISLNAALGGNTDAA